MNVLEVHALKTSLIFTTEKKFYVFQMIGLGCRMITTKIDFSENFRKMAATATILKMFHTYKIENCSSDMYLNICK